MAADARRAAGTDQHVGVTNLCRGRAVLGGLWGPGRCAWRQVNALGREGGSAVNVTRRYSGEAGRDVVWHPTGGGTTPHSRTQLPLTFAGATDRGHAG